MVASIASQPLTSSRQTDDVTARRPLDASLAGHGGLSGHATDGAVADVRRHRLSGRAGRRLSVRAVPAAARPRQEGPRRRAEQPHREDRHPDDGRPADLRHGPAADGRPDVHLLLDGRPLDPAAAVRAGQLRRPRRHRRPDDDPGRRQRGPLGQGQVRLAVRHRDGRRGRALAPPGPRDRLHLPADHQAAALRSRRSCSSRSRSSRSSGRPTPSTSPTAWTAWPAGRRSSRSRRTASSPTCTSSSTW